MLELRRSLQGLEFREGRVQSTGGKGLCLFNTSIFAWGDVESVHDEFIEQAKEISRNKAENASQFFLATYNKVQRESDELRKGTF